MAVQSQHICIGIFLALMSHGILARQDFGPYYPRQEIPQMVIDDIDNVDDSAYNEMRKYPETDPNFLSKWPWLRELLPPGDFEENTNRISVQDRLQYDDLPEFLPTPLPQRRLPPPRANLLKDQAQKKSSNSRKEYMSACHFKICNMGRKRNVRFLRM